MRPLDRAQRAGCEALSGPCTSCEHPTLDCRYAAFLPAALKMLAADDAVVERVALAIFEANLPVGGKPEGVAPLSRQPISVRQHYDNLARAALAALFDHLGVKPDNEGNSRG